MEPIKINVNVEVGLKQTTLEALKGLFAPQILPSSTKTEEPQPQPERKAETKPVPVPETPAPAEDVDDLPPDDAPAPAKTPTEDEARQAVKAARSRGVPAKTIKDFMKEEFNIASSVECPAERRQELIEGLNRLAA